MVFCCKNEKKRNVCKQPIYCTSCNNTVFGHVFSVTSCPRSEPMA